MAAGLSFSREAVSRSIDDVDLLAVLLLVGVDLGEQRARAASASASFGAHL